MSNKNEFYKQYTSEQVVAGYWRDARGTLVPESMIREIDRAREQVVAEIIEYAKTLNKELRVFKACALGDIEAFIELSAEQYNVNVGGTRGNVALFSFDGRYKIQRAVYDCVAPDERVLAAKQLIIDCVNSWAENARPELKAVVSRAFATDKNGSLRLGRLLELRRLDIQDERWRRAMDALDESLQVVGNRTYIRIYERVGDSDEYRPLSLGVSGV